MPILNRSIRIIFMQRLVKITIFGVIAVLGVFGCFSRVLPANAGQCDNFSLRVSPSYLRHEELVPGRQYIQAIRLQRYCVRRDFQVEVEIEGEMVSWFTVEPGSQFLFTEGETEMIIEIIINVPKDAKPGEYQGKMLILGSTLEPIDTLDENQNSTSGATIGIKIGIRIPYNLRVVESGLHIGEPSDTAEITSQPLFSRLRGRIVLAAEDRGQAFYIHPDTPAMYYLGRPHDAFRVMREQGVGITNKELEVILPGLDFLSGLDSDRDGLPDAFEDAVGTDKNNMDTDGDKISDKAEFIGGRSPVKEFIRIELDRNFASENAGKIFLQVENQGEAWYVNPGDLKRYFLGRPQDAFNVMRNLSLGISNRDYYALIQ